MSKAARRREHREICRQRSNHERREMPHLYTSWHTGIGVCCSWCMHAQPEQPNVV